MENHALKQLQGFLLQHICRIQNFHNFYCGINGPITTPYIAVRSTALGSMLFDFKTQNWVELDSMPAGFPNWSRDGTYLYFLSSGNDAAIYRVRIIDHKLEKIVSLKGTRLTIGPVGTGSGLAPDDFPLVLRDVGSQEIYALDLQLP